MMRLFRLRFPGQSQCVATSRPSHFFNSSGLAKVSIAYPRGVWVEDGKSKGEKEISIYETDPFLGNMTLRDGAPLGFGGVAGGVFHGVENGE